jgi:sterol desaturase/sphingolipid hydroxylase (fatty acid hydroxylase superfamily)
MPTLAGAAIFLVLCAGLMIPLEHLFPRVGRIPARGTVLICVSLFVLNTVLMQAVGAPLLAALRSCWPWSDVAETPRLVAAFLLSDLAGYLVHRAMHRVPWLWRFHRVHHADAHLTWLEAWRQHPFDFVVHGIAVGLPGALLGVSLSGLVGLVLARKAWTSFLHADVSLRFGPLERVVATPAFHRLHHSRDPRHHARNFAGTFPFWDLLFGTHAEEPAIAAVGPLNAA